MLEQDFLQTCRRLRLEIHTETERGPDTGILMQALDSTWLKTGRVAAREGNLVCIFPHVFWNDCECGTLLGSILRKQHLF